LNSGDRKTDIGAELERVSLNKVELKYLSVRQKIKFAAKLRNLIVEREDEIAACITEDTRKPVIEALMQEVTATLGMLKYFEKNFTGWLSHKKFRYFRPGFWTKQNRIILEPLGVAAVIGPSNFPFSIPVMQSLFAFLCGNIVILKPSEKTVKTNKAIKTLFEDAGISPRYLSVIEGESDAAEKIIQSPYVNKIIFTGNYENGSKVAQLAGKFFKPVILELGGSGAALVCENSDLESAAKAIAWSAFYSNADSCIGTKRVFVENNAAEKFRDLLKREIEKINTGNPMDKQTDAAALKNSLEIINLEIEDAIAEINNSRYGLSASVWNRDSREAKKIAAKIDAGMIWINDVSAGIPGFPWGGRKQSGWGRMFSREGVYELTNTKAISSENMKFAAGKIWHFPYSGSKYNLTHAANRFAFGQKNFKTIFQFLKAVLIHYSKRK